MSRFESDRETREAHAAPREPEANTVEPAFDRRDFVEAITGIVASPVEEV